MEFSKFFFFLFLKNKNYQMYNVNMTDKEILYEIESVFRFKKPTEIHRPNPLGKVLFLYVSVPALKNKFFFKKKFKNFVHNNSEFNFVFSNDNFHPALRCEKESNQIPVKHIVRIASNKKKLLKIQEPGINFHTFIQCPTRNIFS